jgi:predicted dehydrogenase
MPPNTLVIGYGSIGRRHTRLLAELGHEVTVVSRRAGVWQRQAPTIANALRERAPDYVVVADETARHWQSLAALAAEGYAGPVLVEKPLWEPGEPELPEHRMAISVGYVLRFHPVITELQRRTLGRRIHSIEVRACSYLPDWRPGRDYRKTASARRADGGGVLRDLSHELDYLQWIAGAWQSLTATGGHVSELEIDTDDAVIIVGRSERAPMFSVALNYIDRIEERWVIVNTDQGTLRADIVAGTLTDNGLAVPLQVATMDALYLRQHQDAARAQPEICCSLTEGQSVLTMISAAEAAMHSRTWISQ